MLVKNALIYFIDKIEGAYCMLGEVVAYESAINKQILASQIKHVTKIPKWQKA